MANLSSSNCVFVYGTLKRGQANHHWLQGARFLGRARLVGAELYDLGVYPMAVLTPGSSTVIHGEVFELDSAGLNRLDQLEGYPDLYDRQVLTLSHGLKAWVYLGQPDQVVGCGPVPYGDWGATPVFSYGSNMDPDQLQQRCPAWDGSGLVARLDGWQWGINKRADGESLYGYAGIERQHRAHCWGVVHHLSPRDRRILDLREGVAIDHYRHQSVVVSTALGELFPVLAYVPGPDYFAAGLKASRDYAQRILTGAAHWQLCSDWRQSLHESLMITA